MGTDRQYAQDTIFELRAMRKITRVIAIEKPPKVFSRSNMIGLMFLKHRLLDEK